MATSSNRKTAHPAPAFICVLLIAVAAIAAPQYQDRDHDRDHFHGGPILILGVERSMRDYGGGPGGRPAPDALCDIGFVAVGFHVQTGEFYNQAWLECAAMRSDGSIGEERRLTARTGSPGGAPVHDARCSQNRALRGLTGRSGASIDEASGECSFIRDVAERYQNPGTELTPPVAIPHPGGHPAQAECPAGSVLTGLRSMSGEYMDHLWILCSELQRSY